MRIGNRMNASAFRDMGTSDVLKVTCYLRLVQFENFQNITSDHKSRNARAGSYDFLFIIFSTKLLHRCFHGNFSVLHSITSIALYNLFMHSSLTNQKRDILLSI